MLFNDDAVSIHLAMGSTLVDITQTGDVSSINSKTRNQQRNWETLRQVLGLRTQVILISQPEILEINDPRFGSNFIGKQKVWSFKFGVEQADVYSNGIVPFGSLESDFTNVPIIVGLDETVTLSPSAFCVAGPNTNIHFHKLKI
jgi:hypothetical protein